MNTVNNNFSDEMSSPDQMKKHLEARIGQLAEKDICLAFSDGVDSNLLLKTMADAVAHTGREVYTVMFDNRLHPSCNLEIARHVTGGLGGIHEITTMDRLEQESIKNNPVNRCHLYRRHLFSRLAELAEARGIRHILNGTNKNDMYVYRLGIRALKELGIISPLAKLRITKAQVKALASGYGISVASHPSTPCMATRLPYGAALDYEVLRRIGEEEACIRTMVPGNVHLRLRGDIIRLELDPEVFGVFMKDRREIISRLRKIGFVCIASDAEGFRSGNMNAGLNGSEVQ